MSEKKLRRLRELSKIAAGDRDTLLSEFTMRIPAEPERDADLVLAWAADEIEQLQNAIADLWAGARQPWRLTMQRDLATAPQRYERRSIGDGYYDQPVLTKDSNT